MRLEMGRSGRIQRLPLLLLLVVLIAAAASGKPQQGAGGEDGAEGDYGDNYDEYNPVDYEPEYEEGKISVLYLRNSIRNKCNACPRNVDDSALRNAAAQMGHLAPLAAADTKMHSSSKVRCC